MGVKSTRALTRKDAETRYVAFRMEAMREKFERKAAKLKDKKLEDKLERWNDRTHDGEGFENYVINETGELR